MRLQIKNFFDLVVTKFGRRLETLKYSTTRFLWKVYSIIYIGV